MQQQPGRPRRCNPDEAPKKNPARGSVGCPGGIERGHTATRSAQATATARPPRRKDGTNCFRKNGRLRQYGQRFPIDGSTVATLPYMKLTLARVYTRPKVIGIYK